MGRKSYIIFVLILLLVPAVRQVYCEDKPVGSPPGKKVPQKIRVRTLTQTIKRQTDRIKELEASNKALNRLIKEFEEKLENKNEIESGNNRLPLPAEDIQRKSDRLEVVNKKLKEQNRIITETTEKLREKISVLERSVTELEKENLKLKKDIETSKNEITKPVDISPAKVAEPVKVKKTSENKNTGSEGNSKKFEIENIILNKRVNNLSELLEANNVKIKKLREETAVLQKKNVEYKIKIKKLKQQVNSDAERIKEMESYVKKLKKEEEDNNRMRDELSKAAIELKKIRELHDKADMERESMRQEIIEKIVSEGNYFFNKGLYALALSKYKQIRDFSKKGDLLYYNMAAAYYKMGLYNKALEYIDKAIKLNPEIIDNIVYKMYIYIKLNKIDEFKKMVHGLPEKFKTHPEVVKMIKKMQASQLIDE